MDKESFFISLFPDSHIGDDGAVIANMVYTKDLFCEDVHFRRSWMSPHQIAYKAMLVNISDAIVMNARPRYALIGIEIPASFTLKEMEALAGGFNAAAKEYKFHIIGGDTISGEKLNISITLISETKHPLTRKGILLGDLIAHTGELGSVKRDLEALMRQEPIPEDSKFITPQLRSDFFYEAAPYLHAAMDISDGLSKDLSRLSTRNNIGFLFDKPYPKEMLCSGEEYEILCAFAPEQREKLEEIARKHKIPFHIFATAVKGSYQSECPENHFTT
ncbi:MAG: thiamine-phosphate kinase [Campylobacteraceae bacterium 4484_4]|nr:MAG: thiamine-phosphate kinase [Campylobacteraceae bacterium 4484_4]